MSTLERAITNAAKVHASQKDKGGSPHILHQDFELIEKYRAALKLLEVSH